MLVLRLVLLKPETTEVLLYWFNLLFLYSKM